MKRIFFILIAALAIGISFLQISSCTKNTTTKVCSVLGLYTGTSLTNGVTSAMSYKFENDNFAVGLDAAGNQVTFGGYKNNCDSVTISVYYATNNNYYLLQGALLNNGKTISGTYLNTTTSVSGTFTLTQ